jgi:anthranilate phosphoribosyltransferase
MLTSQADDISIEDRNSDSPLSVKNVEMELSSNLEASLNPSVDPVENAKYLERALQGAENAYQDAAVALQNAQGWAGEKLTGIGE